MSRITTYLSSWLFPCLLATLAMALLGAQGAHAQAPNCGQLYAALENCNDITPGCNKQVVVLAVGAGLFEVQSYNQTYCCGAHYLAWTYTGGDCLIASPQSRATRPAAGKDRLAADRPIPSPAHGSGAGWASWRPQPVYERTCTGEYEIYIAPAP